MAVERMKMEAGPLLAGHHAASLTRPARRALTPERDLGLKRRKVKTLHQSSCLTGTEENAAGLIRRQVKIMER